MTHTGLGNMSCSKSALLYDSKAVVSNWRVGTTPIRDFFLRFSQNKF
jgi:hypothetical protein